MARCRRYSRYVLCLHRDHRISLADPGALIIDPDRERAIRRAVLDAAPEDIAGTAGKGHAMTQTVGTEARLKAAIDHAIEQHSVMCGSHQYR
jgi:UDP-N-acetylmuramyl tripeptide synthase